MQVSANCLEATDGEAGVGKIVDLSMAPELMQT